MTPNDVPEVLDQHISKGQVIERLWRCVICLELSMLHTSVKWVISDRVLVMCCIDMLSFAVQRQPSLLCNVL